MVMILVLTFMLTVPFFTISTYKNDSEKYIYGLRVMGQFYNAPTLIFKNSSLLDYPLIFPKTIHEVIEIENGANSEWYIQNDNVLSVSKIFLKAMKNYIEIHQKVRNPLIAISVSNLTFWAVNATSVRVIITYNWIFFRKITSALMRRIMSASS